MSSVTEMASRVHCRLYLVIIVEQRIERRLHTELIAGVSYHPHVTVDERSIDRPHFPPHGAPLGGDVQDFAAAVLREHRFLDQHGYEQNLFRDPSKPR